jgi:hypothetical protein
MAAGDVTLVNTAGKKPMAPVYIDRLTVEGPLSYATGGHALSLSTKLRGRSVVAVVVAAVGAGATAKHGRYDYVADKLIFTTEAGVEVTATTDLTGQILDIVVYSN